VPHKATIPQPAKAIDFSSCMHVALYSVTPWCNLVLAGCSVISLPCDWLHGHRSASDHWCQCKQAWLSIHEIVACTTELLLHQHCQSTLFINRLQKARVLVLPLKPIAVPSKSIADCCNFETIPMVTVLYAGIQDTLNLIMV